MKLLFMLKHPGSARNLESTLRALGERNHVVELAFETLSGEGAERLTDDLIATFPRFSAGRAPKSRDDAWAALSRRFRLSADYLRYLEPEYAEMPKLRERASKSAPGPVRRAFDLPGARNQVAVRSASRMFKALELATPAPPYALEFIRDRDPDAVFVSPLVGFGSSQADYVRAARKLRIPVGLCVYSWDNLTNKGLIRDIPDLVTVWNQAQAEEAIALQGVPADRIAVTGAIAYDHWFGWSPSTAREEFCARVGLDPSRPYLLYTGSSRFVGPEESTFVGRWLRELRKSKRSELAEIGVLIRPHPQNAEQWLRWDSGDERVAIFPRAGANPVDPSSRSDYFDSIFHSAGVVGINTSALIESAIIGRSVHTLLDDELRGTQEGTLHFHYLLADAQGPLETASSFDEHFAQLARTVASPERGAKRNQAFLEQFIRPYGLEAPATDRAVEAIESIGREPAELRLALRGMLLRAAMKPLAKWTSQRQAVHKQAMKEKAARRKAKEEAKAARRAVEGKATKRADGEAAKPEIGSSQAHPSGLPEPRTTLVIHGRRDEVPSEAEPDPGALAPTALASGGDPAEPVVPGPAGAGEGLPAPASAEPERTREPEDGAILEAREELARLAQSESPILAGPWYSEVGFELLYWIPFLTAALEQHPQLRERLTVVSRGGNAHWYERLGVGYADLFDLYEPTKLNRLTEEASAREARGQRKQMLATSFDRVLGEQVAGKLGLSQYEVLHPALMYNAYWQMVKRREIVPPLQGGLLSYAPMGAPDTTLLEGRLPDRFVALRFYFSTYFPESAENVALVRSVIERLTQEIDVVLLNPALRIDDHWDFEPEAADRIHRIDDLMTPVNNLGVQTAAVSKAEAFIGTYGGLSYLAPLLGVRSFAIYGAGASVKPIHRDLAYAVYANAPYGRFGVAPADEVDLDRLLDDPAAAPGNAPGPPPAPKARVHGAANGTATGPPVPEVSGDPIEIAREAVRALARERDRRVVVAPWQGSTREELLYWIPFLNWVVKAQPSMVERMTIIAGPERSLWYRHLGAEVIESSASPSPNGAAILDPQLMIDAHGHLFSRGLLSKPKPKGVFAYKPIQAPGDSPLIARLPDTFTAVELGSGGTRQPPQFAQVALDAAARSGEVILLGADPAIEPPEGVTTLEQRLGGPADDVARTIAVSRASSMIAPADGLGFLGPLLGVPTSVTYDPGDPNTHDLDLGRQVFVGDDFGAVRTVFTAGEEGELRSLLERRPREGS